MYQRIVRVFAFAAVLGIAACGDDGPVSTGDELTQTEIEALSNLILSSGFEGTASVPTTAAAVLEGPQAVPFSYSGQVDATVECSLGGTVRVHGTADVSGDDETLVYSITYNVDQDHSECVEIAETGQQFTLTSDLAMNVLADIVGTTGGESFSFDGEVTGWVDWGAEERVGGCRVEVYYEASMTDTTIEATSRGTICGLAFQQTFSYGVEG